MNRTTIFPLTLFKSKKFIANLIIILCYFATIKADFIDKNAGVWKGEGHSDETRYLIEIKLNKNGTSTIQSKSLQCSGELILMEDEADEAVFKCVNDDRKIRLKRISEVELWFIYGTYIANFTYIIAGTVVGKLFLCDNTFSNIQNDFVQEIPQQDKSQQYKKNIHPLKVYTLFFDYNMEFFDYDMEYRLVKNINRLFKKGSENDFDLKIIIQSQRSFKNSKTKEDKYYTGSITADYAIKFKIYDKNGTRLAQKGFETSTSEIEDPDHIYYTKLQCIDKAINILSPAVIEWFANSSEIKKYISLLKENNNDNTVLSQKNIENKKAVTNLYESVSSENTKTFRFQWDEINAPKTAYIADEELLPFSPFDLINRSVQNKINSFLRPRDPIDIVKRIPPEIPKPVLPPTPVLVKDQFESKGEYYTRVKKAQDERQKLVEQLQQKYRTDVEDRNKKIEALKSAYEFDIESIKKEQNQKKGQLVDKVQEFTKITFYEIMGTPCLDTAGYDAETQTMYAMLKAATANYKKKISCMVPKEMAKKMYYNMSNAAPVVIFSVRENTIKPETITIHFDGKQYNAKIEDKEYTPEKIQVTLKDEKISVDSRVIPTFSTLFIEFSA